MMCAPSLKPKKIPRKMVSSATGNKINRIINSSIKNRQISAYRSQHLGFKVNGEKLVRHGRYNESEERNPINRWDAQNEQGGVRFSIDPSSNCGTNEREYQN